MINPIEILKNKKDKLLSFIKERRKTINMLLVIFIVCLIGLFVPFRVTYYMVGIEVLLVYCVNKYKISLKYTHEENNIECETFYYKDWLLNITFFYTFLFVYYLYICGIIKGFP